jgi:hypothetical protein
VTEKLSGKELSTFKRKIIRRRITLLHAKSILGKELSDEEFSCLDTIT